MKSLQLHGEDLHAEVRKESNPTVFPRMDDQAQVMATEDREIWLDRQQDDLLDVNDAFFYGELPPLPDFPCMSSTSSSSSTPAPVKASVYSSSSSSASSSTSSSSSAASWAVLRSDAEEDHTGKKNQTYQIHHQDQEDHHGQYEHDPMDAAASAALSSTASVEITDQAMEGVDCMDVMETLGYMDLLDSNDFFDPNTIFRQHESPPLDSLTPQTNSEEQQQQQQQSQLVRHGDLIQQSKNEQSGGNSSEDLALVFLEWLKTNKETVSAEDLRNVKIKKATIECAARRLGGGKEAMKQLLKLILEWVQTNHLQKRRLKEHAVLHNNSTTTNLPCQQQYQDPFQNPNPKITRNPAPPEANPCFSQAPWIPQPAYATDQPSFMPGYGPPMVGYMTDPFAGGAPNNINVHPYPPPPEYHMLDPAQTWGPPQFALANPHYNSFTDNNLHHAPSFPSGYGNQYPHKYHGDQQLTRLCSSATKEARKKRMARQRRFLSHHRNHNNQHNNHQNHSGEQHMRLVGGENNCTSAAVPRVNPGNWVYWPSAPGGPAPTQPVLPNDAPVVHQLDRPVAMQGQGYQRQAASDRRQGWKAEKNLRFLLQKVLKQSDVGNLGRIVLPKKEAETHLPELEARDGISLAMEDIGTSRIWNMRYRFWPNNKSRMYLLENTGDFVKTNGLQEGDFIVIYSDVKCGKYLIRGVKVRQPGPKSQTNKRPGKSRNLHSNSLISAAAAANGSSSSPMTQIVK